MHELAIAQGIIQILEEEARAHGAQRVTKVKVRVGVLSGVVPEALEFAFQMASQGGVAEGAQLEIERVPLKVACRSCGEVEVDGPFLVCPRCGEEAELLTGRELEIESMEIEDGRGKGNQGHP